jgi:hypothetical protein
MSENDFRTQQPESPAPKLPDKPSGDSANNSQSSSQQPPDPRRLVGGTTKSDRPKS